MDFLTRGRADPKGKPRVYIACHRDDVSYAHVLARELLDACDCAVFFGGVQEEAFEDRLLQMQLVVMPVTGKLLAGGDVSVDRILPLAENAGIPVLPVLLENGLVEKFSQVFGNRQYLDRATRDETAIPYEQKLESFLSSVLIGNELADKIRAAFDAYIFLSYRKMDRKYARELMGLIHAIPDCRDVAIWYDEYLIPGEDFNNAIRVALDKCHVFALAVTPNLLQPGNYVLENEYPEAVRSGKPILAAELVHTNREELEKNYAGIPDSVDARSQSALAERLLSQLRGIVLAENDAEPKHMFFIGLAYLNGIDVEVDREKALSLIRRAALSGLPEAAKKLAAMYRNGEGVERNAYKATLWQEYYSNLLLPEYISAHDRFGDRLVDFYNYFLPLGSGNVDWFAHTRWRIELDKCVAAEPRPLLAFVKARMEYCDALRSLGIEIAASVEERMLLRLADLLFEVNPDTDTAVCYVQLAIRNGYIGKDIRLQTAIKYLQNTPEAHRELFRLFLTAGKARADHTYWQRERDRYFRSAEELLGKMTDPSDSEALLLRASLYDAMGNVDRRGYSFSHRRNNGKNRKLLQKAYDLVIAALAKGETTERMTLAAEICAHMGEMVKNDHTNALRHHEAAEEYCRRVYEQTRLQEDLDRYRLQVKACIRHLSSLQEKAALQKRTELLAALGGEVTDDEGETALRSLLRTYYDESVAVSEEDARHWLSMCALLYERHKHQLSDGESLRLTGLCLLRCQNRKAAIELLKKSWHEYADEQAALALPACGCYDEELRAILFAFRLQGADLDALSKRADIAYRFTKDERLAVLRDVLRGEMPPESEDPYMLETRCFALRDRPAEALRYIVAAMRGLEAGHTVPLRVGEDMDVLTVVEYASMGCTLARGLEGGDMSKAIDLYDAAADKLRSLAEGEKHIPSVEKLLLRVLERLADAIETRDESDAESVRQQHRSRLVRLANFTGEESLLRRVTELALCRGAAAEEEIAAAMRLVQITGAAEDKLCLSRLAPLCHFRGVSAYVLLEQILLIQEQLVQDGYVAVKPQLACALYKSVEEEKEHTLFREERMRRILKLMQPLPANYTAEEAMVVHAAAYFLGEEKLCNEIETEVLRGESDNDRRRALLFAALCLTDTAEHFSAEQAATALLEKTLLLSEDLLSEGNEKDVLQLATLYQLCARRTDGSWQDKADRMVERINGIVNRAPIATRLEMLDGLASVLWYGGQHDLAEDYYLRIIQLEEEGGTKVHLQAYCDYCDIIAREFLKLSMTDRAKPWMDRYVAMNLRLLEMDFNTDQWNDLQLGFCLFAELFPKEDRKFFSKWYMPAVRQGVKFADSHDTCPAEELADLGRCLLEVRYFWWALLYAIKYRDWDEVGFVLYGIVLFPVLKYRIEKAIREGRDVV